MKRWTIKKPLSYLKRGVTSLFVCAVVIMPIITMAQWAYAFARPDAANKDPRSTQPLADMRPREIDRTAGTPDLFEEPLITVTFDDGWESVYGDAMPLLNKYGIRTTQYVMAGMANDHSYLSDFQLREIARTGHELDSHTYTHADLATLDMAKLKHELADSQRELRARFPDIRFDDFASPYGSTNDASMKIIESLYRSHRNVDGDYYNGMSEYDVNLRGSFDRYNIIGVTVREDTTVADLRQMVDYAISNKGWLVLNYHAIDDDSSKFAVDKSAIEAQLRFLSEVHVRIVTMGEVLDTIVPRLEY